MSTKMPISSARGKDEEGWQNDSLDRGAEAASSPKMFGWLYRFAAPPEPPPGATFAQQDLVRRGRLASIILLFLLITTIAFIPSSLSSINPLLLPITLSLLVIACIALLLNRRGMVTLAGSLATAAVSLAIVLNLLTAPQGILSTNGLLSYDLLVLSELIAVSLLPARTVFLVAFINSVFICVDIALQPHAPDLAHLLQVSTYTILLRPIALQFVVALVTYLWVQSAVAAIKRADRVEEVARLQRSIAEQKRELEYGIQHVQTTLVQAANGDFTVRSTPLTQDNALWQVASSINMLLTRLQRSNQTEQELQRIRTEINRIAHLLYEAQLKQVPIKTPLTGTQIDLLLQQLTGRYLHRTPQAPGSQGNR